MTRYDRNYAASHAEAEAEAGAAFFEALDAAAKASPYDDPLDIIEEEIRADRAYAHPFGTSPREFAERIESRLYSEGFELPRQANR